MRLKRLAEKLEHGWTALDSRILRRKIPHAILSWRYFLPGQNSRVLLHRRVFLNAWPGYPRLVWVLIALYSYPPWYLFRAWTQVFAVWRKRSPELKSRHAVSRGRQFFDLLLLALGHSIPPGCYYQYRLWRVPEPGWLDFIYNHELPHWHRVMSPGLGGKTSRLMTHKQDFALEMSRLGLPSVATVLHLRQGSPIPPADLFQGIPLFLKPECGSRKQGCFVLQYDADSGTYRLEGDETFTGKAEILACLTRRISRRDYMVQPLLKNHPLVEQAFTTHPLITIRLITACGKERGRMLAANFEIPIDGKINLVWPLSIDADTGALSRLEEGPVEMPEALRSTLAGLAGFRLPFWREVVDAAESAHASFPDLSTIGWDLAITDHGVRLLEGNVNWGVAAHQSTQGPLIPKWQSGPGSSPRPVRKPLHLLESRV